ncbi:MAG: serine hydrolase, partial [Bacteroidota bacterium]
MNKFLFCLLIIVLANTLHGQNMVIEGVVTESKENLPLPYTTVYLKNAKVGTVCNAKGIFKLTFPQNLANDSLVFSHIGYASAIIGVPRSDEHMEVVLKENEVLLNEVVVSGLSAKSVVEEAIKRIPQNYDQDPFRFRGFYRVTSQKDNSYIHLSEAVFDIYQSATSKPKRQFKLEKMRAIKDEKASRGIDLGLKPSGIFEFDIVQNLGDIGLLDKKGLKLHQFKFDGTQIVDGRKAHVISFDQNDVKEAGYQGYLLIDKESFAFLYFDFGLSPKGIEHYKFGDGATRALMKIVGIDITMSRNAYQISYRQFNGKYYLNNVGNDATLTFKSERDHYNFTTDTRVDYILTKLETETISAFENVETLGTGKLIENQNSMYDPDFWKDYNIILSASEFNAIAKKLEANNEANNLKLQMEEKLYSISKDKSSRVDSILSFYNEKDLFNGNALIVNEGEILLEKSYNSALTENTESSIFRIGSLSKTFTSMVVAQLENQGRLNYADSVAKFLPDYPNGRVTIHELLSHQSGIPNFLDNAEYLEQIMSEPLSIEKIANRFCGDSLEFEPGTKFGYSNSNYVLLSRIAEKITGIDYSEVLDELIFQPLEMDDSYFGLKDNDKLVTGYLYGQPEPRYFPQNVGGAGG